MGSTRWNYPTKPPNPAEFQPVPVQRYPSPNASYTPTPHCHCTLHAGPKSRLPLPRPGACSSLLLVSHRRVLVR